WIPQEKVGDRVFRVLSVESQSALRLSIINDVHPIMPELRAVTHGMRIHSVRQLIGHLPKVMDADERVRVDGNAGVSRQAHAWRPAGNLVLRLQSFRRSGQPNDLIPVLLVLRPFFIVDIAITDTE